MNAVIVLAAIIASVLAGPCTHTNHSNWTERQVIDLVVKHLDRDDDGVLTKLNIAIDFVLKYDLDFQNGVEKKEFITQWFKTYHDEKAFAAHVFKNLDLDNSGSLDTVDVELLVTKVDTDSDGLVTTTEFREFLLDIYNAC